jgi:hypothetical protein
MKSSLVLFGHWFLLLCYNRFFLLLIAYWLFRWRSLGCSSLLWLRQLLSMDLLSFFWLFCVWLLLCWGLTGLFLFFNLRLIDCDLLRIILRSRLLVGKIRFCFFLILFHFDLRLFNNFLLRFLNLLSLCNIFVWFLIWTLFSLLNLLYLICNLLYFFGLNNTSNWCFNNRLNFSVNFSLFSLSFFISLLRYDRLLFLWFASLFWNFRINTLLSSKFFLSSSLFRLLLLLLSLQNLLRILLLFLCFQLLFYFELFSLYACRFNWFNTVCKLS